MTRSPLDTFKLLIDLAVSISNGVIAIGDARGRRREERRKEADESKDREIADLKKRITDLEHRIAGKVTQ